ncbi:hypothetical protein OKW46_005933 [Paraburkholderia sp. WSM4179]|nr:hypothetical protein [Paraburkholderia sp. WSM4179]
MLQTLDKWRKRLKLCFRRRKGQRRRGRKGDRQPPMRTSIASSWSNESGLRA